MLSLTDFLIIVSLSILSQAHMQLYHPPPFAATNNPYLTGPPDLYLHYPYNCCERTTPFPCKGYLNHLNTPQGRPVVSWSAGSEQNFSLTGTGNHYGGSCQVGFSINGGTTWKVVKSFEGNCPHRDGGTDPETQSFEFRVPGDIPVGVQVFAWTWINREREFSMLCAAVEITSGEARKPGISSLDVEKGDERERRVWVPPHAHQHRRHGTRSCGDYDASSHDNPTSNSPNSKVTSATIPERIPFNDRPSFLFANINNGCRTPKTYFELKYPNPGPDVAEGDGEYQLKLPEPVGQCS
ncbi:hypothetical protein AJ78_00437 [Emergomyces pasteurianus Ep9510]|uniref:Endoglucanase n=1 Tax=Emergomyces pasteurianus Ep9510 TaxID=1447872 RepID=A0A1J9QUN1_9EURO|nr:hypothetical protein AJ78_00437 [Emergomyces pasteurianus Ep9510]